MRRNGALYFSGLATLLFASLAASAQSNPVGLTRDVVEAATLDVPIDPATRVDPASLPGDLSRRALAALGLIAEQLAAGRTTTYSATKLDDELGSLTVFHASVVRDRERHVFWSEDLPREATRASSEVQLAFDTERGARYLVDFALDSAEQEFAVVVGNTRTTQTPERGHVALVVTGTGREVKLRLLPLGDASFKNRRFTLFQVSVTPLL